MQSKFPQMQIARQVAAIRARQRTRHAYPRTGAAAVEAALVLPLLIIVTFGAVDIAQYINMSQVVANASREGALVASDFDTRALEDVENAIKELLQQCYPRLTSDELNDAVTIEIHDQHDAPIFPANLTSIPAGDPVLVRVGIDFSAIRWLQGPQYGNNNIKVAHSVGRRE